MDLANFLFPDLKMNLLPMEGELLEFYHVTWRNNRTPKFNEFHVAVPEISMVHWCSLDLWLKLLMVHDWKCWHILSWVLYGAIPRRMNHTMIQLGLDVRLSCWKPWRSLEREASGDPSGVTCNRQFPEKTVGLGFPIEHFSGALHLGPVWLHVPWQQGLKMPKGLLGTHVDSRIVSGPSAFANRRGSDFATKINSLQTCNLLLRFFHLGVHCFMLFYDN